MKKYKEGLVVNRWSIYTTCKIYPFCYKSHIGTVKIPSIRLIRLYKFYLAKYLMVKKMV